MKNSFLRFICRMLIASLACLPLQSQAGLIGTNQVDAGPQLQSARADIADKLAAYGVAPEQARSRVAALTDAEVASLAEQLDNAPAGASAWIGVLLVLAFLVWRFAFSEQAQAESGKKK